MEFQEVAPGDILLCDRLLHHGKYAKVLVIFTTERFACVMPWSPIHRGQGQYYMVTFQSLHPLSVRTFTDQQVNTSDWNQIMESEGALSWK